MRAICWRDKYFRPSPSLKWAARTFWLMDGTGTRRRYRLSRPNSPLKCIRAAAMRRFALLCKPTQLTVFSGRIGISGAQCESRCDFAWATATALFMLVAQRRFGYGDKPRSVNGTPPLSPHKGAAAGTNSKRDRCACVVGLKLGTYALACNEAIEPETVATTKESC